MSSPRPHGELTRSPSALDPDRLTAHTRIMGATGTGKSSLIQNMVKHQESAHALGTFSSSAIVLDVKGDDSPRMLRQLDPAALESGRVAYIDVNSAHAPGGTAPVGINVLELPPYRQGWRETVVSQTVGNVMETLKEVYSQQQPLIQVERVMRLSLFYLYSRSDSPTMDDLYGAIVALQHDPTAAARMAEAAPKDLRGPLTSLAKLRSDQWIPLVNRIEPFIADPYLRRRLSVPHSTVDFGRMFTAGSITIFRLSEAETPAHAHPLIARALVMKAWQAALARAESGAERTPAVVYLDEFHMLGSMSLLETMVSRGRSLGLGLVLANQNGSQVRRQLADTLDANAGTHIYGRLAGQDAAHVATMIDPANARAIAGQLGALPNHTFMAIGVPPGEHERAAPARFASRPPPPPLVSERDAAEFEAAMCRKHGPEEPRASSPDAWRAHLGAPYLAEMEWRIVLALAGGELNRAKIAGIIVGLGLAKRRSDVNTVLDRMIDDGLVTLARTRKRGVVTEKFHALGDSARAAYIDPNWSEIGTAGDVAEVASAALAHYGAEGKFACIAAQGAGDRADMVVYDHRTRLARTVEVESRAEVTSNPQHVAHNMAKATAMGFSGCDVWSLRAHIVAIRDSLEPAVARTVRCFVREGGSWVCH